MDAPVVRRVCARVDGARLAFRAIKEVVREDARVDHGKGSDDGRARRLAGLVLDDEVVVLVTLHICSDTGELNLGAVRHGCANECRHGAGEGADVHQAGLMPLLELADFTLF